MIEGLTPRAQRVLTVLAKNVAKRYRASKLLTEHIVLAILGEAESVGSRCLINIGINVDDMIQEIEKYLEVSNSHFRHSEIPPSHRVKILLENAATEATILSNEYIGTEHFILAAVAESGSATHSYLSIYNVTTDVLRGSIQEIRAEHDKLKKASFRNYRPFISNNEVSSSREASTEVLDNYSRDLTSMASKGLLDPVIGRESEINRVMRILARRTKNNPVLIGDPGVGKTAIAEGLAQRIVSATTPDIFSGKKLVSLDLAAMVAGTKYRGEFEDRLKKVIKEIYEIGNIIVFIDELHTIIGAGGAEGAIDASNMLKPALSRGEFQCIGATTINEYRKYIEKDPALERRFQSVFVEEPDGSTTLSILQGVKKHYEDYHNVTYGNETLLCAVELADRYISERNLPDKAIDLIDEAGANKRMSNSVYPPSVTELEKQCRKFNEKKISYVNSQDYENAAQIRDKVKDIRSQIEQLKSEWEKSLKQNKNSILPEDIQHIISENTGIPMAQLVRNESEKLLKIEEELHKTIVGQDRAINAVSSAVRRSRTGLNSPHRPLGSFMFLGPTGVGKTLVAKGLAEYLFGDKNALIRIDMSDFMEKHNVSRLVGAPPGYIGYEEGGILTEKIRKRPYAVILLDEIEKAHVDVFNMLLQVFEEGELQDSLGHKVSFRNTLLIMTSNAGARDMNRSAIGFNSDGNLSDPRGIRSSAMTELNNLFRPEFINRLDEIVVFQKLSYDEIAQILDMMLQEICCRLQDIHIELIVSKKTREVLMKDGFDINFGARPLRRTIQKLLEDPLSMAILEGRFGHGDVVSAEVRAEKIVFRRKNRKSRKAIKTDRQ